MPVTITDIMDALGQDACAYCGETDTSQLVLEHMTGSGNAHRRALRRWGSSFYRWYAQQGYPESMGDYTFGIACRACNLDKSLYEDRMRERAAATIKRKQVFGSIKESNYEWLREQRETTHKSIGEILDPLIERAIAEQEETDQPAVVSSSPAKSYKYMDIEVDRPPLCPVSEILLPERLNRRRGILAWLFGVRP